MNDAGRPVITWVQSVGIVFTVLGRRILDGKQEVFRRGTSLALSSC